MGGAHPTPYYCGYPNVVGRVGGRVDRLRWRGSEFRLQAAQDRVNAELQTDETSRVTVGRYLVYAGHPIRVAGVLRNAG